MWNVSRLDFWCVLPHCAWILSTDQTRRGCEHQQVLRCCAVGSQAEQDLLRSTITIQPTKLCNSPCCYRLESPTRALVMEAPKGIEINAEAGSLKATCRTELRLESKDGEVSEGQQALQPHQTKPRISCRFVAFWVTEPFHVNHWCEGTGEAHLPSLVSASSDWTFMQTNFTLWQRPIHYF